MRLNITHLICEQKEQKPRGTWVFRLRETKPSYTRGRAGRSAPRTLRPALDDDPVRSLFRAESSRSLGEHGPPYALGGRRIVILSRQQSDSLPLSAACPRLFLNITCLLVYK
jgi:hypothetical protein